LVGTGCFCIGGGLWLFHFDFAELCQVDRWVECDPGGPRWVGVVFDWRAQIDLAVDEKQLRFSFAGDFREYRQDRIVVKRRRSLPREPARNLDGFIDQFVDAGMILLVAVRRDFRQHALCSARKVPGVIVGQGAAVLGVGAGTQRFFLSGNRCDQPVLPGGAVGCHFALDFFVDAIDDQLDICLKIAKLDLD